MASFFSGLFEYVGTKISGENRISSIIDSIIGGVDIKQISPLIDMISVGGKTFGGISRSAKTILSAVQNDDASGVDSASKFYKVAPDVAKNIRSSVGYSITDKNIDRAVKTAAELFAHQNWEGIVRNINNDDLLGYVIKYTDQKRKEMESMMIDVISGKSSISEFGEIMKLEIAKSQVAAAVMGRGSASNLTDSSWDGIQEEIKRQNYFLERLVDNLREKQLSNIPIGDKDVRRAGEYSNAIYTTAKRELGDFIAEELGDDAIEMWVTTAGENCQGCAELDDGQWYPIGTLPEIGSQECGAHCRCRKVYSTRTAEGFDKDNAVD